ncbi:MAG TPA: hypothetical protein VNY36_03980 [Bacteroidia bacterium]|jgi:hypothetical protein|nr:hypothetical protein [Bacteroidia bacterium]
MKPSYPYKINILIAVLSIGMGILYIGKTFPGYVDQVRCPTCKFITTISLEHYWYRWCLYTLLIFSGYRLINRLLGARRLYYLFFAGITIVAIRDIIQNKSLMDSYDMVMEAVLPLTVSILGFIYFRGYYMSSLKNR